MALSKQEEEQQYRKVKSQGRERKWFNQRLALPQTWPISLLQWMSRDETSVALAR
jgi:hypothetical protein